MTRAEWHLKYSMDGPALIAAAIVNQYRRTPIEPNKVNPYRQTIERTGIRITKNNLKAIADAIVNSSKR